ncbi:MAG: hypothetical protein IIC61_14195 [Proteobacteria bacterium]|nr:hypothetical protein [Pseudomonadota bacterium]
MHFVEANEVFAKAVEADPDFAMGYVRLAQTSQTAAAFFRSVRQAEYNAANSSEGEQLYIRPWLQAPKMTRPPSWTR